MLMPMFPHRRYQPLLSTTLNEDVGNWSGYCVVAAFGSSLFSLTGGRVRLSLSAPKSVSPTVISSAYIGMAATAPNFDGNQVQLLREGDDAPGFTLPVGGADVKMMAEFRPVLGGTILVAFSITSGATRRNTGLSSSYAFHYKAGDAANAGATTKTGYSTTANRSDIVSKIEILR